MSELFVCNKCGYCGRLGPRHDGCNYDAAYVANRSVTELIDRLERENAALQEENKTLRALATCACGDGFTAAEPGACVNCAMMRGGLNL